jgi:uncharacterized protein (DUF952 family)
MNIILHIAEKQIWETATKEGKYRGDTLETEGFIHCSTAWQVIRVANHLYQGRTDLVLLFIDTDKLQAPLRYEPPTPDAQTAERFPHLYGPLNIDAVVKTEPLKPDEDGVFRVH